jgi:hypothetical protein
MQRIIFSISLTLLFLAGGCTTFTSYEMARTVPEGQLYLSGAVTTLFFTSTSDDERYFTFFPVPELSIKYGIRQNLDLGLRWVLGPGINFNAKYQFLRGNFDGALFLEGSFYGVVNPGSRFGYYSLKPELIFSREKRRSISLGIGLYYLKGIVDNDDSQSMSLVGHIGLPRQIGMRRSIILMPAITLMIPLYYSYTNNDIFSSLQEWIVSLGIGLGYVGK